MATKKNQEVIDTEITKEETIEDVKETEATEKEPVNQEAPAVEEPKAEEPKKEGIFNKAKNAWNSFEVKHPKIAKGIKITGLVGGGALIGYGAAKMTSKKEDATEIPETEPVNFIGCDDNYDDYNEFDDVDIVDEIEVPVEDNVESTVEVTEF